MVINPASAVRKLVSLPHALLASIEDFRFSSRIKTESEAIRTLIEAGLEAQGSVTAEQLIMFCHDRRKSDIAQIIETLVFEFKNPSDLPLLHSHPQPLDQG